MNRRGIDLAVREINNSGGIHGRPMEVIAVDDSSAGARAVTIATGFVNDPRILGVVGHIESGPMEAAARVYDGGLPAIATTATSPTLTGLSPWVFRVISSDSVNGRDLAVFARSQGFARAAVLYENTAYGRGLAEAIGRHFGGAVVARDPIAADSTSNVEPNVAYLRTRQPDIVFVAGTAASGLAVLREARRQGLRAVFAGGDGWSGVATGGELAEGIMVAVPFTPTDPRPEVAAFVQAFRAVYGADPDGNAALAYDATRLLARAIAEAGPSRLAVRDYLRDHLATEPYKGVTGSIQFAASGDVIGKPFVMTRVRGGALLVANAGTN
jgi:branched-chain amino acid transport system substrate-binding protein